MSTKEIVDINDPLTVGTYFFTFAREEISPLLQLVPNWQQRAANQLASDSGVVAEFAGGGYVNLSGHPPGAFYQMRIDVKDDGVITQGIPVAVAVVLSALAVIAALPVLAVYLVERVVTRVDDLFDGLPDDAITDVAAGVKWFGVAAVVIAVLLLVNFMT